MKFLCTTSKYINSNWVLARYKILRKLQDEVFKRKIETMVKFMRLRGREIRRRYSKPRQLYERHISKIFRKIWKKRPLIVFFLASYSFWMSACRQKYIFNLLIYFFMHSDSFPISKYLFWIFDVLWCLKVNLFCL